jgi:hypothetical protein
MLNGRSHAQSTYHLIRVSRLQILGLNQENKSNDFTLSQGEKWTLRKVTKREDRWEFWDASHVLFLDVFSFKSQEESFPVCSQSPSPSPSFSLFTAGDKTQGFTHSEQVHYH